MNVPIFVYDTTATDEMSRVRGIGRYMRFLKQGLPSQTVFTANLSEIPKKSLFINPFFDFLKPPVTLKRVSNQQVAIMHDTIPFKYPSHFPVGLRGKVNKFLNNYALHNYDFFIANSQTTKHNLSDLLHINASKISVVYPAIDAHFYVEHDESDTKVLSSFHVSRKKYVLYVGDATWNKNLVHLAEAVKASNVSCIVVGKVFQTVDTSHPWQRELARFLEMTKDDSRFIFTGYIDDATLRTLYANAACNLMLSRDEGFGFSYVEAGSQKTATIASNIPVFHETAGISAIFTESAHPDFTTRCIKKVMNDEQYRKQYEEKAKKRSEFFSPEHSAKQLRDVLAMIETQMHMKLI